MDSKRIFLLGTDGLYPERLHYLHAFGGLPFLSGQMKAGHVRPMATSFPGVEAGWASLVTGQNPGWHGVYHAGSKALGKDLPGPLANVDDAWVHGLPFKKAVGADQDDLSPKEAFVLLEQCQDEFLVELKGAGAAWKEGASLVLLRSETFAEAMQLATDLMNTNLPFFTLKRSHAAAKILHQMVATVDGLLQKISEDNSTAAFLASFFNAEYARRFLNLPNWLAGQDDLYDKVFCPSGSFIRLLVHGRDEDGVVEPGKEACELLAEISKRLSVWRDPINQDQLVQKVYQADDLYTGDRFDEAPDLFAGCYPGNCLTSQSSGEAVLDATRMQTIPRHCTMGRVGDTGLFWTTREIAELSPTPINVHTMLVEILKLGDESIPEGKDFTS